MQSNIIKSVDEKREWLSIADYRSFAMVKCNVELEACGEHKPLNHDVIPLVAAVRNERVLIEAFLKHYRRLGIGRFLIVDNGSDDGTYELLAEAPDVDLWRTTASYKKAGFGVYWQDGLLSKYAANRWVLYADVDEFLVFSEMEKGIGHLIKRLTERGQSRLFAPLLDMYSQTAINQTEIASGQDPLEVCCWFDSDPESYQKIDRGISVKGGVRRRLFFEDNKSSPELAKYPLMYYDNETALVTSHFPEPKVRNFAAVPYGRLLHAKYIADLNSKIKLALKDGQHWNDSVEYRQYQYMLMKDALLTPHYSRSAEYTGPDSLVAAGFMQNAFAG